MNENVRENKAEETKQEVTNEMLMEEMKVIREALGMILNNQANELRIRMNEAREKGNEEEAALYMHSSFATIGIRDKVSGKGRNDKEDTECIGYILKMLFS